MIGDRRMRGARPLLPLLAFALLWPALAGADGPPDVGALKARLLSDAPEAERVQAGISLAAADPNALADALDDLVKRKQPADVTLLAGIEVQLKPRHERLLLTWEASRLGGATEAFLSRIDNDHPNQSVRAVDALGFLRDSSATEKLLQLARGDNELLGVAAARALARVATKRDADALVQTAVDIDNDHVRQHLAWAVKDVLKSAKVAHDKFARLQGKGGTVGFRARAAASLLEDDRTKPEPYKVKLDAIRGYFGRKIGAKPPAVDGPKDTKPAIEKALEAMKATAPDWYHFVCATVGSITISGNDWVFDFNRRVLNLRLRDIANWKDSSGNIHPDYVAYYVVRWATIMFLQQMGDPSEGHRGWEEGIADGWWYAMDHTQLAVDKDLQAFMTEQLNASPPPW